jgi:aspartyl-tRNA(Asn)/glutamyl-tRNA(Gln) amidotransferase subunit A
MSSNALNQLTLTGAIKALREKKVSLDEIYQDVDSEIAKSKKLNIYTNLNPTAKDQATKLGDSPLAGLPMAVKDNYCTKGLTTTASAKMLEKFVPQYDSTVARLLGEAGGVVVGKTNLDAWAHGSSTETSDFGPTLNPRNPDHLPGGSSGGSAAAVASNTCLAALGTETAGSIRQPAAWCGVVGLKPSYGRVSRSGIVAMASSTDSPGPITKTVEDAALLLQHISGLDAKDSTTSPQAVPNFSQDMKKGVKGLRIGLLYSEVPELKESLKLLEPQLKVFERLGASIEPVKALDPHYAIGVYTIVQRAEVSSNLARYTGVRYGKDRSFLGSEARKRIMLGTFTLSKGYADQYYTHAQKVRSLFRQDFDKLFQKYDLLVSLSSPGFAKKVGATEGQAMFGELEDMLLEPSSIVGLPGLNVPCYRDEKTNLFLGLNIMAPMWQEAKMIQAGYAFEQATDWNEWTKS